jgi:signal transduction histidine kinase
MAEVRGISMQTQLGPVGRVAGDQRALHRLLSILLDNAIQHTPKGGTVGIETLGNGGSFAIAVRNSGEGISSEDLPHIFERFYRGDPARTRQNGAGLGLAIAKSIAEAHSAYLEVESAQGKGAVFRLKFSPCHHVP